MKKKIIYPKPKTCDSLKDRELKRKLLRCMQVLHPQAPHKPHGPCQLLPIHMNGPKPYSSNFKFPVKTRKFQHSSRYGMYAGCNILSAWTVSIWTLTLILYIPRHFQLNGAKSRHVGRFRVEQKIPRFPPQRFCT